MNRSAVLLVVAAVACGLLGWLALHSRDAAPAVSAPSTHGRAEAAAPTAPGEDAPTLGEREAVAGAPERETDEKLAAAEHPDIVVAVLHDGRPVAGGEVWSATALDEASLTADEKSVVARLKPDPEAVLRRFGQRTRTGADGRAAVPSPTVRWQSHVPLRLHRRQEYEPAFVVAARDGDRFGLGEIRGPDDPVEIELHLDQALRIHVDDAGGHPAEGVAVAWEVRRGEHDVAQSVPLGATNGDGDLPVPHSQHWAGGAFCAESRVMVQAPGVELPPVDVQLARPVPSYVGFELPPTGRIRVVIEGADGTLYDGHAVLWITEAGAMPSFPRFGPDFLARAVQGGETMVPWVGLGKRFEVRCQLRPYPTRSIAFDGPTRSGETIVHRILLSDQPSIEGRALRPDGTPLSGARLRLRVRTAQKTLSHSVPTGDDGAFRALFGEQYLGQAIEELQIGGWLGEHEGTGAVLVSPGALVPGLNVGDVTIADLPLLAAGRVVDGAGDPLSDFYVNTRAIPAQDHALSVRKTEEGRFEVRDSSAVERIRLRAVKPGYLDSAWQECARGATDVELVLRQEGRIAATLARPFDLGFMWAFQLSLTRVDEPGKPWFTTGSRVEDRHFFQWRQLEPGTYRLEGRLAGHAEPAVVIDGVEVHAGDNEDPRLRDIELPGLRAVHVTLVDERGEPLAKRPFGRLYVARDDDPSRFEETTIGGTTRPVLLLHRASADVVVEVYGYVPGRLRNVTDDVTVRLRRPLLIPVTIDTTASTPHEIIVRALDPDRPRETFVATHGLPPSPIPHSSQAVKLKLAPGATGELPLPGPGVYELDVRLERDDERQDLRSFTPRVLSIEPGTPPPQLKLTIPASAIPPDAR